MDNFGEWLLKELKERGMSQTELSQSSGLSQGTISNIISGRRGRGLDSLQAIARALRLPPETVYREAGVLPAKKNHDKEIEQIVHEFENMNPDERKQALAVIRALNKLFRKKK